MKIIQDGILTKENWDKPFRHRCYHCQCIFELCYSDITITTPSIGFDGLPLVRCPQCHTEQELSGWNPTTGNYDDRVARLKRPALPYPESFLDRLLGPDMGH